MGQRGILWMARFARSLSDDWFWHRYPVGGSRLARPCLADFTVPLACKTAGPPRVLALKDDGPDAATAAVGAVQVQANIGRRLAANFMRILRRCRTVSGGPVILPLVLRKWP